MANITTTGFATEAVAITKNDALNQANHLHGASLYVGGGGHVAVVMTGVLDISGDDTKTISSDPLVEVIFKNVPSGTFLPIAVDFLVDTGTSATDILKLG